MRYPVFVDGANLYVGDPHFAQGDGEVCGTAIEASLTARIEVSIERGAPVTAPQLETDTHWFTHGFGDVGVTQVVDGRLGCHASIAKSIL